MRVHPKVRLYFGAFMKQDLFLGAKTEGDLQRKGTIYTSEPKSPKGAIIRRGTIIRLLLLDTLFTCESKCNYCAFSSMEPRINQSSKHERSVPNWSFHYKGSFIDYINRDAVIFRPKRTLMHPPLPTRAPHFFRAGRSKLFLPTFSFFLCLRHAPFCIQILNFGSSARIKHSGALELNTTTVFNPQCRCNVPSRKQWASIMRAGMPCVLVPVQPETEQAHGNSEKFRSCTEVFLVKNRKYSISC